MKIENIRIFDSTPDYRFSDDENTALLWPESVTVTDGSTVTAIRSREHYAGSAEIIDLRIYGYAMPASADEYNEIIRDALDSEIENV